MPTDASRQIVQAAIVSADRRRRVRDAGQGIWRIAPWVSALALAAGAAHRWLGWTAAVPVAFLAAAAIALAVYWFVMRRPRPVSDLIAAHVDADARLNGELRSASWFSTADTRDAWTEFHIERAADRIQRTDWTGLYPSIRQPKAWAATAVMALAALGLSVTLPARAIMSGGGAAGGARASAVFPGDGQAQPLILPPELQKKLEELLAGIESGQLKGSEAIQRAGELKDLLALLSKSLDPDLRKQIAQAAMDAARGGTKLADAKALAERAKRDASNANTPSELRKALDDIASQLGKDSQSADGAQAAPSSASSASSQGAQGDQAGQQQQASGDPADGSIQFARDSAGGGASQAMMVSSGLSSNDPRPGEGGNRSGKEPDLFPDIAQALRRETVEANSDTAGENVTTETRRKTEQGRADARYTHAAAASFDRARGAAPPPVPEPRRAQVQSYFIRKQ